MPYDLKACLRRIKRTMGQMEKSIYRKIGELETLAYVSREPLPFGRRLEGRRTSLALGQAWGGLFDCAWFLFTGTVPEEERGGEVVLILDISGEAYIAGPGGSPVQGITTASSEYDFSLGKPVKKVVYLPKERWEDGHVEIWADGACNDLFGNLQDNGVLRESHMAVMNKAMKDAYYDFEVLHELMKETSPDNARHFCILYALYEASGVFADYTEEEALRAREILRPELERRCVDAPLRISAIGHAHLDLAWRWPVRETIRKGARTFSTALMNLEKYPDYVFGASQPQLYQWIREHYPELYEKVRERVKEGRWEAQGAMWVESDTNITGGESLVRQVLYGKAFFQEEFGEDIRTLWLPDVFGYSAALPQILKKSGVDYFMTIKLSWSEFNTFPHHTFWWQGMDGSRVLAHMPPEGTYNSSAAPRAVKAIEKAYLDKGISEECMMLFGIGDGGGGPGEEHLERLSREKALQGLLPVKQEFSRAFFERLAEKGDRYKTWVGELYLEYHRGTYTTQGRSKYWNRKMETALRELELACAKHGRLEYTGEVRDIWKEVLLYQFHDILPGSSITRVYEESNGRYALLHGRVNELLEEVLLEGNRDGEYARITNSLSMERKSWVHHNGTWKHIHVPPMAHVIRRFDGNDGASETKAGDMALENDILKVVFHEDGSLSSVFDKENDREVVKPGTRANMLGFFRDDGDAWDFPHDYRMHPAGKLLLEDMTFMIDGPRAVCRLDYLYGDSRIRQDVVLVQGSRRIDFETHLDWNDSNVMMRTSFPVSVRAAEVSCEIQFGHIRRPTHGNTSWDMAKFEVCAHKWADLSQRDYGVALLNDCKYGYSVSEDTLDLCLLRSTAHVDRNGEKGEHIFTYSLYPHKGDLVEGKVIEAGYDLNVPLRIYGTDEREENTGPSYVMLSAPNIHVEAVKLSEDGEGVIIRMYESVGARTKTRMVLCQAARMLQETDLMEVPFGPAEENVSSMDLVFSPFEIKTVKATGMPCM
ncbi:MAG: glycoside hydrolase family 38 C-terminal domain-containing protein [Clostridia bacterium]